MAPRLSWKNHCRAKRISSVDIFAQEPALGTWRGPATPLGAMAPARLEPCFMSRRIHMFMLRGRKRGNVSWPVLVRPRTLTRTLRSLENHVRPRGRRMGES